MPILVLPVLLDMYYWRNIEFTSKGLDFEEVVVIADGDHVEANGHFAIHPETRLNLDMHKWVALVIIRHDPKIEMKRVG
jgi:hypothetical protein